MQAKKSTITDTSTQVIRIGGRLREVVTVRDAAGVVLHKVIDPLMLDFKPRDVVQVVVGATLLAIPVAFTEEVWKLGVLLPLSRIFLLAVASLLFTAIFVYYNFYRRHFSAHKLEFFKRTLSIYLVSLCVCGAILFIIGQAPWATDWLLALKRTIIVALPASLSAAVVDMLK